MRAAIAERAAMMDGFGDPVDAAALLRLLQLLYATGRADLPLGRLFEGNVDALQIVTRYGDADTVAVAHAAARNRAAFGVWNADLPGESLRIDDDRLHGAKSYASGAGILTHALVTADDQDGRRLLLVDLVATPPAIEEGWWNVVGMQRSQTHIVRWDGVPLTQLQAIGVPGCYAREPWFSGGALRFVTVHAGAIAGLCDRVRDHLVATGRAGDPHQAIRLARLFALAQAAAAVVREVAGHWFSEDDAVRLARVASARGFVADCADEALTTAQQAVGLSGMFVAHPLSAAITDLMVYLRQPMPDAQRERAGAAVADGRLVPTL